MVFATSATTWRRRASSRSGSTRPKSASGSCSRQAGEEGLRAIDLRKVPVQRPRRDSMDDSKVTEHIGRLAREEHELFDRESRGIATDADRERLRRIQVALD